MASEAAPDDLEAMATTATSSVTAADAPGGIGALSKALLGGWDALLAAAAPPEARTPTSTSEPDAEPASAAVPPTSAPPSRLRWPFASAIRRSLDAAHVGTTSVAKAAAKDDTSGAGEGVKGTVADDASDAAMVAAATASLTRSLTILAALCRLHDDSDSQRRSDSAGAGAAATPVPQTRAVSALLRKLAPVREAPPPTSVGEGTPASTHVAAATGHALTIHLAGADFTEGRSVDECVAVFEPLFAALFAYLGTPSVTLQLSGPGVAVPAGTHHVEAPLAAFGVAGQRRLALTVAPSGGDGGDGDSGGDGDDDGAWTSDQGRCSATIMASTSLCHDVLADTGGSASSATGSGSSTGSGGGWPAPDIVLAFDAGVWGYSEWHPSMQYLAQARGVHAPVVVTSYNGAEAVDDYDALVRDCGVADPADSDYEGDTEAAASHASPWLWRPEANTFASRASTRAPPNDSDGEKPRFLADNSHWQCFAGGSCPPGRF